jgi:hypothetical protein
MMAKDDKKPDQKKNPNAVALGKLGGEKGGPARDEALSPKAKHDIAKKAADTRWGKDEKNGKK